MTTNYNSFSWAYENRKPMLNRFGEPVTLADLLSKDNDGDILPMVYACDQYQIYSVSESEQLYNDCLNYLWAHTDEAKQFLVYGVKCGARYSEGAVYIDMTVEQSYEYCNKADAEGN